MDKLTELLSKFAIHNGDGYEGAREHLCVTCGGKVKPIQYPGSSVDEYPAECSNCHHKWLLEVRTKEAGIPPVLVADAYEWRGSPSVALMPLIKRIAEGIGSVALTGPTGTGKSVLAAQVAMGAIRRGVRGKWLSESEIPDYVWGPDATERLSALNGVQWVALDDIGLNENIARAVEAFIDWAYTRGVHLIVTSNIDIQDMSRKETMRRAASRLLRMAKGASIGLQGGDRRIG